MFIRPGKYGYLAYEVLHETFLRLEIGCWTRRPVRSPVDYAFRVAINLAGDHQKSQQHWVSASAIDALLDAELIAPGSGSNKIGGSFQGAASCGGMVGDIPCLEGRVKRIARLGTSPASLGIVS